MKNVFNNKAEQASFLGLPVGFYEKKGTNNYKEILKLAVGAIHIDWDYKTDKVWTKISIDKIHESWFEPSDKGGLSVFGFNTKGEIIFGMALYEDNYDESVKTSLNASIHGRHYLFFPINNTNPHPWY